MNFQLLKGVLGHIQKTHNPPVKPTRSFQKRPFISSNFWFEPREGKYINKKPPTPSKGLAREEQMGSAAVDKTEEELRKEIEELHRQQWEVHILVSSSSILSHQ